MSRGRSLLISSASLLVGAALWEITGRMASPAFWVPLSTVLVSIWDITQSGLLVSQVLASLRVYLVGLTLAVVVAAPLGLGLARWPRWRIALEDYLTMLNALPMVALIPFILSLMGFGFAPKALVVFLFAFFPVLFNTIEGALSVRPELLEVARSFRSTEWQIWRDVIVPHTWSFIMVGIRQAIARGLVGMVAAEFFLSPSGLGEMIMMASQNFDTASMLAAILIMVALAVLLMRIGVFLERRYMRWR
jgi:ABC-type nitrate/sulfonate/bicarbonate transport system permease component